MLSTGEMVTLAEDPEKGDATVDTDGDGVPDLLELVEKIYITIPGTNKQAEAWTYRSNPVKRDTDGDGFSDREDPAPMSYDITIENAYGNVVKLNTDAVWSILGMDINEFYENYYIRYDSPATKDIWESYKRILDLNRERFYTPEELAFLIPIDLNGVKDYIKDKPEEYKEAVYLRLHAGEELSGENIREKTEKFFTVKTKGQIWLDYVQTSLRQLVMGKYTTERNSLGTLGEIGIAFTGADFLADCRDLSYDIENWEFTWEHAGETVLDAIGLLPVIGTAKRAVKISKTDDFFAIVKVGDYVFSFRRLGNISELLSQNGWKYLSKDLALAGSAGSGMDILGDDLYYYILKSCDDMDDYKYLYNNPVMDAFQKHADEIKYLQETNPDKIDDIIDSAKASGIKDADELADFTADAIEAGKKGGNSAKGLIGHDFEDYLTKTFGGEGAFNVGGREFDGGIGNRWWEAKSGNYWSMLEENPNKLAKFKSDMGDRLRIATENGATYEIFTNTPIPESIKQWLTQKGITFTELLD